MAILSIDAAIEKLRSSKIVALPTETVYGLAGSIESEDALKNIFKKKSRPFFDPLIVHVENLEQAKNIAHVDEVSQILTENFWPGPLTVVVPKKEGLSDLITNGGSTVALRCPNHPLFLQALKELGHPIAAPSANVFGKTSPTTARHVLDDFQENIDVVDGGACLNGIESTIVEVNPATKRVSILRPGIVDLDLIHSVLEKNDLTYQVEIKPSNSAPGHLLNHYQPEVPFVLIEHPLQENLTDDLKSLLNQVSTSPWEELKLDQEASLAARSLYGQLRKFSKNGKPIYLFFDSKVFSQQHWLGLADRVRKASSATLTKTDGKWMLNAKT